MTMRWLPPARRLAVPAILAAAALAACTGGSGHAGGGSTPARGDGRSSSQASARAGTPITGIVQFKLPPAGQGCAGARRVAAGGTQVPVTVSTRQSQVAAIANVCINGRGPFPFLVDTGAQGSVVAAQLAARLGLPKIGPPVLIGGAGCTARARVSRIASWNVAGLALQPQLVTYLKIPLFGGRGEPAGLLGSDVWSRFGAMRLDFARGSITVPGPERPGPAGQTTISRPTSAPVPASLLRARPAAIAPMTVTTQPGSTAITVTVSLGTEPSLRFTPDTGASQSAVDPAVAQQAGLASANARVRQGTVCTVAVLPEVRTGPWAVAGHRLRPQVAGLAGLLRTAGVAGLLGSDQMSRFGSVIFDYGGGRLVLGAG